MFDIDEMNKRSEEGRIKLLLDRFGSRDPDMSDKCTRCLDRYGNHYGTVSYLQCPDEWIADGHSLA